MRCRVCRDMKPENMMLHVSGGWLLADFGSATTSTLTDPSAGARSRAEDDIRRHTTAAYRAPEQWDLFSRQPVDHRVDLWVRHMAE